MEDTNPPQNAHGSTHQSTQSSFDTPLASASRSVPFNGTLDHLPSATRSEERFCPRPVDTPAPSRKSISFQTSIGGKAYLQQWKTQKRDEALSLQMEKVRKAKEAVVERESVIARIEAEGHKAKVDRESAIAQAKVDRESAIAQAKVDRESAIARIEAEGHKAKVDRENDIAKIETKHYEVEKDFMQMVTSLLEKDELVMDALFAESISTGDNRAMIEVLQTLSIDNQPVVGLVSSDESQQFAEAIATNEIRDFVFRDNEDLPTRNNNRSFGSLSDPKQTGEMNDSPLINLPSTVLIDDISLSTPNDSPFSTKQMTPSIGCLSSAGPRQQDLKSSSKRITFGSPSAVEFDAEESSKFFTPMPKEKAKKKYPMIPTSSTQEEDGLRMETKRNNAILNEWEDAFHEGNRSNNNKERRESVSFGRTSALSVADLAQDKMSANYSPRLGVRLPEPFKVQLETPVLDNIFQVGAVVNVVRKTHLRTGWVTRRSETNGRYNVRFPDGKSGYYSRIYLVQEASQVSFYDIQK